MIFNTIQFGLFLPLIFGLYWFVFNRSLNRQNGLLLVASYWFYACWDWRFLFLLIFSTLLDYYTGLKMQNENNERKRKMWFWTSVVVNLGFLGVFKYYDFFVTSFAEWIGKFGIKADPWTLNLILPVGISFYTFHGLSYVIDIYKRKIDAERQFVDYAVFVSFFPLLVAGPIERATHLLPQIKRARIFDSTLARNGLKQILWGLFKKVVIADTCAEIANHAFINVNEAGSLTLIFGAIMFAFQIYGDFSGYSDMALGTAKLFGIRLLKNFAFPYLSRDMAEFWRRWHISLSSWFRDYVYFPLGGSREGKSKSIRNTFVIFLLSGFWHGANWTFIFWGFLNACFFLPLLLRGSNRQNLETVAANSKWPSAFEIFQIMATFGLVTFAWIFFRASSLSEAFTFIERMFTSGVYSRPELFSWSIVIWIALLMSIDFIGRKSEFGFDGVLQKLPKSLRYTAYYCIILLIFFNAGKEQQFIYFQF
jgi:alginate O-acetyltransferase complex protein AlgI